MRKAILPFLIFIFTGIQSNAQVIDAVNDAVSGATESSNSSGGDNFWLWIELIEFAWYPTMGTLFGYEGERHPNELEFSRYPYELEKTGFYLYPGEIGKNTMTEISFHFHSNNDELYSGYGKIKFSPVRFLNIEANRWQLWERVREGGERTNQLSFTNFSLQYNRVRHHRFQGWWGGGVMIMNGREQYVSPQITAGLNWFFLEPLSIAAQIEMGFPNGTYTSLTQATIQMHIDRFKVYGGFQGLRAGEVFEPGFMIGTGVYF